MSISILTLSLAPYLPLLYAPCSEYSYSPHITLFRYSYSTGKLKQDHQIVTVSTQEDVVKAMEAANAPHKGAKVVIKFEQ